MFIFNTKIYILCENIVYDDFLNISWWVPFIFITALHSCSLHVLPHAFTSYWVVTSCHLYICLRWWHPPLLNITRWRYNIMQFKTWKGVLFTITYNERYQVICTTASVFWKDNLTVCFSRWKGKQDPTWYNLSNIAI